MQAMKQKEFLNNHIHNNEFSIFDFSGDNFMMPSNAEYNNFEEELFPKSEFTSNQKQKQYFRIPKFDKKQLKMILNDTLSPNEDSEQRYLNAVIHVNDAEKPAVPSIQCNNSAIKNVGILMLPKISNSNQKINEIKEEEYLENINENANNKIGVQSYLDTIHGIQAKRREKEKNNVETNFVSKNGRSVMFSRIAQKANLLISTETDEEAEENSSFYSNPSIFNVTNEPVSNKNFYNITTVGQMSRNKQNSHTSLIPINEQIAARMNKTKDKDKFDKWNLKQDFSQEQLFPSNL